MGGIIEQLCDRCYGQEKSASFHRDWVVVGCNIYKAGGYHCNQGAYYGRVAYAWIRWSHNADGCWPEVL